METVRKLPIPGLFYIPNFITKEEEKNVVSILDANEWQKVIRRRQQFWGVKYYHTTHNISTIQPVESCESLDMRKFSWLLEKITDDTFRDLHDIFIDESPNQILVNEYVENFGISTHFDDSSAFGKCIVTLSLISPILMTFRKPLHPTNHCTTLSDEFQLVLEPRSCLIMTKESRYNWRHGITRRKWFEYNGEQIHRNLDYRRISLTIREVLSTRKKAEYTDLGQVKVDECECIIEE
eukprot:NODE_299_length_11430_cov_0.261054.p6 type:complete len:237 gc:universal NODE_299_length_11430_cov_0.261054:1377-2087(+)